MSAVITGFVRTPAAQVALARAIDEARLRNAPLVVVHSMKGGGRNELAEVVTYRQEFDALRQQLENEHIDFELIEFARGNTPAQDIVHVAAERDAQLIVIGVRDRSTVGQLILGSTTHDILVAAPCPVLAVRVWDQ